MGKETIMIHILLFSLVIFLFVVGLVCVIFAGKFPENRSGLNIACCWAWAFACLAAWVWLASYAVRVSPPEPTTARVSRE